MLACTLTHFDSRHSPLGKSLPSRIGSYSHSPLSPFLPSQTSLSLVFSPFRLPLPLCLLSSSVIVLPPSCRVMMVFLVTVIFSPLLSQQIKRAGGADCCWQEVSSSSAETCNFVPRKVHTPKQKRKLLMHLMFLKLTTLYSYPSTPTSSLWVCCFVMQAWVILYF